jgi:putative membrane protein
MSPTVTAFPDAPASGGSRALRWAVVCLVGHAFLSFFSAYAFSTFLSAPTPPAWLQTPTNQTVMRVAWALGPATTVVLGALAGVLHATGKIGGRRALAIFGAAFVITLGAELTGTHTGYPFGPYSYTTQLGYRVLGLVPFNIPTSWFFMLYCALAICGRLLAPRDDARSKWVWAIVGGVVLTAWDVSMDPAMVTTAHWLWHLEDPAGKPAWIAFLTTDFFYGMPITNWLGWLLTGFVVARAMLALVPPSTIARQVSPTSLPLWLYAVNGVLPIAICVGRGLWGAVVAGTIAMGIPLALALRAGRGSRVGAARAAAVAGA